MKKLRLDPDALKVESFGVPGGGGGRGRGTVRAHSWGTYENCPKETMVNYFTCGISCVWMCQHTMEVPGCGVDTDYGCV